MIGLGLDIWRGVKGVGGGGGGVPLPAPLTGIDTIMLVGASIEAGIGGNAGAYHSPMLNYCNNKLGLTGITSIVTYGYAGAGIDTIYTNWTNTIKPALAARGDGGAGVLILTMPAGNDVTSLAPYDTANSATLAARKATYDTLIAEMKTQCGARNVVCFDHTFRLYNYPATDCITDENLGSKRFNEQWVDPQAIQTPWNTEGHSYGYPYPIAYNWYNVLLIDSTHFNTLGYQIYGRYWMDVAGAVIKGTAPPVVAKKANPIGDQKPKSAKAMLVYRNTAGIVRSSSFPLANARGTQTTEQPYLAPWDGYSPVLGLGARAEPNGGYVTQSGLGTGDTSYTILNDLFRDAFVYTTSTSFVVLEEIINLSPFQQVEWKVLCCRNVAGGVTRWQEFSDDGTTVKGSIDAACVPGATPRVFTTTSTADANGKLKIYFRLMTGNVTGAYASALEINPI